jgi:hypothetical protein
MEKWGQEATCIDSISAFVHLVDLKHNKPPRISWKFTGNHPIIYVRRCLTFAPDVYKMKACIRLLGHSLK